MKNNIICLILICFLAPLANAQFWVGPVDYSKIDMNPDLVDPLDNMLLELLISNEVTRYNIRTFVERSYREDNAPVIRNKTAPFLARVLSDYYDEKTKVWRTVQGIGSLVNIEVQGKEYTALLTVSHLTQGQRLRIYDAEGKILSMVPGSRLANIDEDTEIILLKDKVKSALHYEPKRGLFMSTIYGLSDGLLPKKYEVTDYDRIYVARKQHVPIFKSLLPAKSNGQNFLSNMADRELMMQKIMEAGASGTEFFTRAWNTDGLLEKQFLGNGYIANARMLPGLSGAPLIRDIPEVAVLQNDAYFYSIEGLVQGHHRFENKSYFVGKKTIQKVADAFLSGARNYTSQTRWRLRDGMTFRDFGNGVIETNIIKTPSSSFFKGESGNAISVDGDQGVAPAEVEVGMQNGYNSAVLGRFLKAQGKIIPVLADPQMEKQLPQDFEPLQTFGADQDLLKLAEMKYEFRNKLTNYITNYECFYQVSDKGIRLKVFKGDKIITEWQRDKAQLQAGFKKNELVVQQNAQQPKLELSGLFFTDMTSIPLVNDPLAAGAPSVTVAPFGGLDSEKVGCFGSKGAKNQAIEDFKDNMSAKMKKIREKE